MREKKFRAIELNIFFTLVLRSVSFLLGITNGDRDCDTGTIIDIEWTKETHRSFHRSDSSSKVSNTLYIHISVIIRARSMRYIGCLTHTYTYMYIHTKSAWNFIDKLPKQNFSSETRIFFRVYYRTFQTRLKLRIFFNTLTLFGGLPKDSQYLPHIC